MNTLALLFPVIVTGLILALMPRFYRPTYVFGNTIPPGFQHSDEARSARRAFERDVLLWSLLAGGLLLAFPSELMVRATAVPVVQVGGVLWSWLRQRRRMRPFAVAPSAVREARLDGREEHIYGGWIAWLLPFALLAGAAFYIEQHWHLLPDHIPTHYGFNGPDAWGPRSWRTVYGPLVIGLLVMSTLLTLAGAIVYGARRGVTPEQAAFRVANLRLLLALHWCLGFMFAVLSTAPVRHIVGPAIPFWLPLGLLIAMLIIFGRQVFKANQVSPAPDQTPDECWHAGDFYYNPADSALIVEKRFGIGYTVNLAHKIAWVMMAQILAIVASVIFLARG